MCCLTAQPPRVFCTSRIGSLINLISAKKMKKTFLLKALLLSALGCLGVPAQAAYEYHHATPGVIGTTAPATDPLFTKVAALFNFDGTLLSTPTVSVTATGLAFSAGKFSQALDLSANTASATRVAGLDVTMPAIGTQDFTIEGWLNTTAISAAGTDSLLTGASYVDLLFRPTTRNDALYVGGASCGYFTANTWPTGTWAHFAIERKTGTVTVYKNGTAVKTCSAPGAIGSGTWKVGSREGNSEAYSGRLDELRVTIGQARYNGNFTPPSQPFPLQ